MRYKFSKRDIIIFLITAIFVISVIMAYFVIVPLVRSFGYTGRQIQKKHYLLKQQSYFVNHGGNIDSLHSRYKDILREFSSDEEMTEYFFEAIKHMATERSLTVRRVTPLVSAKQKLFKQTLLELELEGEFKSIFQLVDDLENSPALININSLTIRSHMRNSNRLQCRMSLSKIFF